jgi:protein ImuB
LIKTDAKGVRVFALNKAGYTAGLKPSMRLSDARAICHDLASREHDSTADKTELHHISHWLERYSPSVQPYGADSILIDSTGCDHLFGGEQTMLADIYQRLTSIGYTPRLGLADTIGAAFALARHHENPVSSIPVGQLHQGLAFLPVRALRLADDQSKALYSLGLKTIGQLFDIPRASLARRFDTIKNGPAVLQRLDQALGFEAEPLIPQTRPAVLRFIETPPEPCLHLAGIEAMFELLLERLLNALEKTHQGLRHLRFTCFYTDRGQVTASAGFATPCRTKKHIKVLFADQLTGFDPRFGFDAFVLSANKTENLNPHQVGLLQQENNQTSQLPQLIDRLVNRLGKDAVFQLQQVESHLPEKAQVSMAMSTTAPLWQQTDTSTIRPITIFAHPEIIEVVAEIPEGPPMRFRWRRVLRQVAKANGPERISPEWWNDPGGHHQIRDYYQVEDSNGQRYWLFRVGRYDQPANHPPHWRIHGLFL